MIIEKYKHTNYQRGVLLRLVDAVYARIIELVKERQISVNALANISGVPRPTIVTMTRSSTVKLSTIYGICDGLKITLQDFSTRRCLVPKILQIDK